MDILMPLALMLPLLLVVTVLHSGSSRWLIIAPLPALYVSLMAPVGSTAELGWLMLGTQLTMDATGQYFLMFSSIVWFGVSLYFRLSPVRPDLRRSFAAWFLLAMAGNMSLILAADVLTFYFGFTLMGLSAYGMLLGCRGQRARAAARLYLAMTLIGEVALFAGMVILVGQGGAVTFAELAVTQIPDAAVALLLLGFGIKLALPCLHIWLPPVYTTAPIVAVAVLSGPMMKAGLLGMLRFVQPGSIGNDIWPSGLIILGVIGMLLGTVVGLLQKKPRAVLAYSSIAKMGLMSAIFGVAMQHPEFAPEIIAALVMFAMHHLLVKSALFIGVGVWERHGSSKWLLAGISVLALALSGIPFSGGAAAKSAFSTISVVDQTGLYTLLALAAIGAALMMARLLYLLMFSEGRQVRQVDKSERAAIAVWFMLVILAFWGPFLPWQIGIDIQAIWPVAIGLIIALLTGKMAQRYSFRLKNPAFGDPLPIAMRSARWLQNIIVSFASLFDVSFSFDRWRVDHLKPGETGLDVAGVRWLVVIVLLLVAIIASG